MRQDASYSRPVVQRAIRCEIIWARAVASVRPEASQEEIWRIYLEAICRILELFSPKDAASLQFILQTNGVQAAQECAVITNVVASTRMSWAMFCLAVGVKNQPTV